MNISIKTIPHKEQRYPTIGDWWEENGEMKIRVSEELENPDYCFMIVLHELIEQHLCRKRGITQEMVDEFDNAHLDIDDPGLLPEAPYHKEHLFSLIVEGMIANQCDVDFTYDGKYNNKLGEVCPSEPSDHGESKSMFEGKVNNIKENL